MTVAELRRRLPAGTRVEVTNHYITRPDHPCFGTRTATVLRATSARVVLDAAGKESPIDWPKRGALTVNDDGTVTLLGGGIAQDAEAPFLTIRWL